jgi:3-methyladenine DNA glycosylase/8-oxoguanine DNA glycosylase
MKKSNELPFPKALAARRRLPEADPAFRPVISHAGRISITLDPKESVFQSLAVSIIYQQLHGKAAAAITARFQALYPGRRRFPNPKQVLETPLPTLRSTGLSESKARAILDLAKKVIDKTLPDRKRAEALGDEELIEAMTSVKGVGPWTAQMLLIFTLGRTDVLPTGDYGVRKGFALLNGMKRLPTPAELARHGERWKPYRSAAAWYLWRVLEMEEYQGVRIDS